MLLFVLSFLLAKDIKKEAEGLLACIYNDGADNSVKDMQECIRQFNLKINPNVESKGFSAGKDDASTMLNQKIPISQIQPKAEAMWKCIFNNAHQDNDEGIQACTETFTEEIKQLPSADVQDISKAFAGQQQSFHRPSEFHLSRIAEQLGMKQPFPIDYNTPRDYEIAYNTWQEKVITTFLTSIHPFQENVRFTWQVEPKNDIPAIVKMIKRMIHWENTATNDYWPLYHGTAGGATFLMQMYQAFQTKYKEKNMTPKFSLLRMSAEKTDTVGNFLNKPELRPFMEQHMAKKLAPVVEQVLSWFDNNREVTTNIMAVSPTILMDAITESPLFFFVKQTNVVMNPDLLKMIVGNALRVIGYPEDQIEARAGAYVALQKRYEPVVTRAIAQIFIKKDIWDDVTYVATRGGVPFNLQVPKSGDVSYFKDGVTFLRYFGEGGYTLLEAYIDQHPELEGTELYQQFKQFNVGKEYWEHALQLRILATSTKLYAPENLVIKTYVEPHAEKHLKAMQHDLQRMAEEDINVAQAKKSATMPNGR